MGVFETLSSQQQSLIEKHLQLVIEANKSINLTRISSVEEAMALHVEDSLAGLEELNNAPSGLYGDLGSGAGYPGIPLAIASGRRTVLIDSRKKKMDVVSAIIENLGLSEQIKTYAGRAELLARQIVSKERSAFFDELTWAATRGGATVMSALSESQSDKFADMSCRSEERVVHACEERDTEPSSKFRVLTARAMSQLPVLLELASPLLEHGGKLICYKAHISEEEFSDAGKVQGLVGMELVSDRSFTLQGEYQRRIVTFAKVADSKVALPRQEGQAQKHPLSE